MFLIKQLNELRRPSACDSHSGRLPLLRPPTWRTLFVVSVLCAALMIISNPLRRLQDRLVSTIGDSLRPIQASLSSSLHDSNICKLQPAVCNCPRSHVCAMFGPADWCLCCRIKQRLGLRGLCFPLQMGPQEEARWATRNRYSLQTHEHATSSQIQTAARALRSTSDWLRPRRCGSNATSGVC